MTYTLDTPITFVKPSGTAAEALAWLDVKAGAETEYVNALWDSQKFSILDPAIIFAQAAHETGDFSSPRWLFNRNPAGLGIESNEDDDPAKLTASEAALLHAWAMLYVTRKTHTGHYPTEKARAFMDRWIAKVEDPNFPRPVETIGDLGKRYVDSHGEPQAVWGWDERYAEKIVAKANSIFRWGITPQEVTPSMAQFTTTIPGLPGGPLVTDYPISLMIIPESQKINRPGTKARLPREGVQHGAGNPNSFARGDAIWAFNGAKNDRGEPTQTSFHATADEFGVTVLIPADEITYQAADGGGPGNMNGFSCEMSENAVYRQDMTRLRKNIYVNADFMGRVAARLNIAKPKQHWDFNFNSADRHNCPNILRTMSIGGVPCWTIYTNQWNASKADEVKRMSGSQEPQYATPLPITWQAGDYGWRKLGDVSVYCLEAEVEVVRATTPLAWADGDKSDGTKAPNAGPKIKQGERFKVIGSFANLNEKGQTVRWLIRASDNARVIGSSCRPLLPFKQ